MVEHHQDNPNARLLSPAADRPRLAAGRGRFRGALSLSLTAHVAAFLLAMLALNRATPPGAATSAPAPLPDGIVWIAQPGPGGGGGGGGNRNQEPPQVAQARGADPLTVRVVATATPETGAREEAPHRPIALDIPSVATSAGIDELPGILGTIPFASVSLGPGSGNGAGDGNRGGIGSGDGDGLGDGRDGGTGGGAHQPGDGVSMPRLIYETKPNYTGEAVRAKVQGSVWIEAIVTPDGLLSSVQVTRSLDPHFGLDQEAIRTVREWRFLPGRTRDGKPVPVRVAIEMAFTLR